MAIVACLDREAFPQRSDPVHLHVNHPFLGLHGESRMESDDVQLTIIAPVPPAPDLQVTAHKVALVFQPFGDDLFEVINRHGKMTPPPD